MVLFVGACERERERERGVRNVSQIRNEIANAALIENEHPLTFFSFIPQPWIDFVFLESGREKGKESGRGICFAPAGAGTPCPVATCRPRLKPSFCGETARPPFRCTVRLTNDSTSFGRVFCFFFWPAAAGHGARAGRGFSGFVGSFRDYYLYYLYATTKSYLQVHRTFSKAKYI